VVLATTLALLDRASIVRRFRGRLLFALAQCLPADAVAAAAIIRRLGVPHRIQVILEGESLVMITALVALQFAIAALVRHFLAAVCFGRFCVGGRQAASELGCCWRTMRWCRATSMIHQSKSFSLPPRPLSLNYPPNRCMPWRLAQFPPAFFWLAFPLMMSARIASKLMRFGNDRVPSQRVRFIVIGLQLPSILHAGIENRSLACL